MKWILKITLAVYLFFQPLLLFANPVVKMGVYGQWYVINSNGDLDISQRDFLRRARLRIYGSCLPHVFFHITYDAALGGLWRGVWIRYKKENEVFTLGQILVPWNSIYNENSAYSWFNELALPIDTFDPDYRDGASYHYLQPHWSVAASIFFAGTRTEGGLVNESANDDSRFGSTQRFLYFPSNKTGHVMMFGLSNWYQKTAATRIVDFGTVPEATGYDVINSIDTGEINSVRFYDTAVAEWLFSYKRFAGDIAYIYNFTPRINDSNLHFSGWYAQFSYFLNNTTLNFNPRVGGVTNVINRHLSWQLVFRLSSLDLNSRDIHGGREFNMTAGLNFYFLNIFELGFNYIRADVNASQTATNGQSNIYLLKSQIYF